MIKATVKIVFWRLWDIIIRLIWPFTSSKLRKYLWNIIDSQQSLYNSIRQIVDHNSGVFIQVGSNDGVSNDPLRPFVKTTTSNVYLIEPLPFLATKLIELYHQNENVKVLQTAILPSKDNAIFYHLDEDSAQEMGAKWKPWFDQIGSFSKDHLVKHSSEVAPYIREISISCSELNQIIKDEGIKEILMLHVDAEGHDLDVLNTISIEQHRPHMILFEHKHTPFLQLVLFLRELEHYGYRLNIMHDDILCIHKSISYH